VVYPAPETQLHTPIYGKGEKKTRERDEVWVRSRCKHPRFSGLTRQAQTTSLPGMSVKDPLGGDELRSHNPSEDPALTGLLSRSFFRQ